MWEYHGRIPHPIPHHQTYAGWIFIGHDALNLYTVVLGAPGLIVRIVTQHQRPVLKVIVRLGPLIVIDPVAQVIGTPLGKVQRVAVKLIVKDEGISLLFERVGRRVFERLILINGNLQLLVYVLPSCSAVAVSVSLASSFTSLETISIVPSSVTPSISLSSS